jgi:hypothetical protein
MPQFVPTVADILASCDVIRDVEDAADSMPPAQAVESRIALEKVIKAARDAIGMLNTELLKRLDGQPAIVREGQKFYVGPKKESKTFDHDGIEAGVIRWVHAEREPAWDERRKVREAVHAMAQIYVSPSTDAKVTQLDAFDIPRRENADNSVLSVLRGVREVKSIPAPGEPDTP